MTVHAINQRSPDILRRHGALILPVTFLAMHEAKSPGMSQVSSRYLFDLIFGHPCLQMLRIRNLQYGRKSGWMPLLVSTSSALVDLIKMSPT